MGTGAITQYVDVAQIVLYMFWAFFAGLIYYLLRENHREGYPMDNGHLQGGPVQIGWPVPEPKVFKMADGREILAPDVNRVDGSYNAQPAHAWLGAPLEPRLYSPFSWGRDRRATKASRKSIETKASNVD
jgi:photosynthetic reaction center H subunit